VVEAVTAPGLAADAGVQPGFRLVRVNGVVPQDLLDFRFAEYDSEVVLEFASPEGTVLEFTFEKEEGESLGIQFRSPVFDGVRRCRNRCSFCFCDQLPPGVRPSLAIRDDDYRLSFLSGNFITLTNLEPSDIQRIRRLRLSPLYVSVHAVTPAVRRQLFGVRRAETILPVMDELLAAEVELHTQVVLVPGVNDGEELTRTVAALACRRPGVASLALVPVGLTRYRPRDTETTLRPVTPDGARQVLAQVASWQREFVVETGVPFVYGSDELYLLAGEPFPPAEAYDDFPQLENGVGLCRLFLDDLTALEPVPALTGLAGKHVLLATGVAARGLVAEFARRLEQWYEAVVTVVPIRNDWLGQEVTVAGLLCGHDLCNQLRPHLPADLILLPTVCVNEEGLLLDDRTPDDLAAELGVPVLPVGPLPSQAQQQLVAGMAGTGFAP